MAADEGLISTGVDKLIKLVYTRKRILIKDAARELAISQTIIEEWARVLEEEGILRIEYQLTNVFLVWTGTPVETSTGDISDDKISLVREVEGMITRIKNAGQELELASDEVAKVPELIDQRFSAATTKIDLMKTMISEVSETHRNTISEFAKLKEEAKNISKTVQELEERRTTILEELPGLEQKAKEIKKTVEELHYAADDLRQGMKNFERLKGTFKEFKGEIEAQSSALADLEKELKNAENEYGKLLGIKKDFIKVIEEIDLEIEKLRKRSAGIVDEVSFVEERAKKEGENTKSELKALLEEMREVFDKTAVGDKRKQLAELVKEFEAAQAIEEELEERATRLYKEAEGIPVQQTGMDPGVIRERIVNVKSKLSQAKTDVDAMDKKREELRQLIKRMGEAKK